MRFEQFRVASELSTESGERQVSSLHFMGVNAVDALATTSISDNDKKDYSKVMRKFNDYFKVQKTPSLIVPTSILQANFLVKQRNKLSHDCTR